MRPVFDDGFLGLTAFFPLGFPSFISSCGFGGMRTIAAMMAAASGGISTLVFPTMANLKAEDAHSFHVTKMDAARRQLRTAIRLWFADEDPVAIHTLLAASHEILHRLFRDNGLNDLLFDSDLIEDGSRGEWARFLKSNANFFKHVAHKDERTILFYPIINELFLVFCLKALNEMGETIGLEEEALKQWLLVNRPDFLKAGVYDKIPVEILVELRTIDKKEFLNAFAVAFDAHKRTIRP